jgi:hypothetical protein
MQRKTDKGKSGGREGRGKEGYDEGKQRSMGKKEGKGKEKKKR